MQNMQKGSRSTPGELFFVKHTTTIFCHQLVKYESRIFKICSSFQGRQMKTKWADSQNSFSACQVGPEWFFIMFGIIHFQVSYSDFEWFLNIPHQILKYSKTSSEIFFNIRSQILKDFLLSALRSIGLRCMEHLFFLRIVGEVFQTSYFHKKNKALMFSLKRAKR